MRRPRQLERAFPLMAALTLSFGGCSSSPSEDELASSPIVTMDHGEVKDWPEASAHLSFSEEDGRTVAALGPPSPSGLDAYWSVASIGGDAPPSAFFYADWVRGTDETRIARASGATRISDVTDASSLTFTRESVGPVTEGSVVVIEHEPTKRYLVLIIDHIAPVAGPPPGGPFAVADVRWYLGEPGETDFRGVAR